MNRIPQHQELTHLLHGVTHHHHLPVMRLPHAATRLPHKVTHLPRAATRLPHEVTLPLPRVMHLPQ